jgi:sensor domain CHASE-containing protein
MFHEFVDLDATEKGDIVAALIRCRALTGKTANELRKRGTSTSLTTCRWQTSEPPLSMLPISLDRKADSVADNTSARVIKGSQMPHCHRLPTLLRAYTDLLRAEAAQSR